MLWLPCLRCPGLNFKHINGWVFRWSFNKQGCFKFRYWWKRYEPLLNWETCRQWELRAKHNDSDLVCSVSQSPLTSSLSNKIYSIVLLLNKPAKRLKNNMKLYSFNWRGSGCFECFLNSSQLILHHYQLILVISNITKRFILWMIYTAFIQIRFPRLLFTEYCSFRLKCFLQKLKIVLSSSS